MFTKVFLLCGLGMTLMGALLIVVSPPRSLDEWGGLLLLCHGMQLGALYIFTRREGP